MKSGLQFSKQFYDLVSKKSIYYIEDEKLREEYKFYAFTDIRTLISNDELFKDMLAVLRRQKLPPNERKKNEDEWSVGKVTPKEENKYHDLQVEMIKAKERERGLSEKAEKQKKKRIICLKL